MNYIKPRLPEEEIRLCIEMFSKEEAADRIIRFVGSLIDLFDKQAKLDEDINRIVSEISKTAKQNNE
jgi:hypothetical protein